MPTDANCYLCIALKAQRICIFEEFENIFILKTVKLKFNFCVKLNSVFNSWHN